MKTITKSLGKIRKPFVAINMMNKCARFHGDSPKGKKVKFNLPSAIELSETADFVQVNNFGGTFDQLSFEFFYEIFTEDASQFVLYHGAKSQNYQKLKSRGGGACLNPITKPLFFCYPRQEHLTVVPCKNDSRRCW